MAVSTIQLLQQLSQRARIAAAGNEETRRLGQRKQRKPREGRERTARDEQGPPSAEVDYCRRCEA